MHTFRNLRNFVLQKLQPVKFLVRNKNISKSFQIIYRPALNDFYNLVDMLNFHLDQDLTILESIPFCDDNQDNYNMNSVDAIIACLRSVNFWSFDGIHLSGIRNNFKIHFNTKKLSPNPILM